MKREVRLEDLLNLLDQILLKDMAGEDMKMSSSGLLSTPIASTDETIDHLETLS